MWRDRMLLAVSFAVFAAYVGTTMIVPVRVLFVEQQGASLTIIGAMATAFLISNFIFQYPMGWIADHWGRKNLMFAGLLCQALISLLYIAVTDPILFVMLRFIEGIASATMLSPARAMIIDMTQSDKRGQAYGVFNTFFNASWVLGPGIGSLLAAWSYQSVFVGAFLARIIASVVVLLVVREVRKTRAEAAEASRRVSLRELLTLPLVGAYILVFGDYLYLGFDQTLFPIWMHDNLGATVTLIGLTYITWGGPPTLLSSVGGRIADRVRRSSLILAFGLAQVPIYVIYGLLDVAWPILVLGVIHSSIYAMMQPAVDSHLAASSIENARGRVQGFYSSVGLTAAFIGANGFTLLYGVNFRLPLFTMALLFGLCVVIGGSLVRLSEARGLVVGPESARKEGSSLSPPQTVP